MLLARSPIVERTTTARASAPLFLSVLGGTLRAMSDTVSGLGWIDLAANAPGIRVSHEAARQRQAHGVGADRSWRVGADGELIVAGLLRELTSPSGLARAVRRAPRWRVLHSVPLMAGVGAGDIDHLLIGPPGVVTINTKHHRGGRLVIDGNLITVDEFTTDYVQQARDEAASTAAALGTRLRACGREALARRLVVHPVVAVHGGALQVLRWPLGVTVATTTTLVHALRTMPPVIDAGAVEEIYAIARRSTTWSS